MAVLLVQKWSQVHLRYCKAVLALETYLAYRASLKFTACSWKRTIIHDDWLLSWGDDLKQIEVSALASSGRDQWKPDECGFEIRWLWCGSINKFVCHPGSTLCSILPQLLIDEKLNERAVHLHVRSNDEFHPHEWNLEYKRCWSWCLGSLRRFSFWALTYLSAYARITWDSEKI